ncbi:MAG TPA: hypothetical protein VGA37_12225 [Gemmatimonadales bacterium]
MTRRMLVGTLWFTAAWWMGSMISGLSGLGVGLVPIVAAAIGVLAAVLYVPRRRAPLAELAAARTRPLKFDADRA